MADQNLAVKAVMTLDASGMPAGAAQANAALNSLTASHNTVKAAAGEASGAMRQFSAANDEAGLSSYRLTRALTELGGPMGARVLGMREMLRGSHDLIEGLGVLNTTALGLGVAFVAAVGHTTIFREALSGLESGAESLLQKFDDVVSGTQRVARAQADAIVDADQYGGKVKQLREEIEKLKEAMKGPDWDPGFWTQFGQMFRYFATGGAVLPDAGPTAQQSSAYKTEIKRKQQELFQSEGQEYAVSPAERALERSGEDALRQQQEQSAAYAKRAQEELYKTSQFLPNGQANNMVFDPVNQKWRAAGFEEQGAYGKFDQQQTADALKNVNALPLNLTPWDPQNEIGWAMQNGLGSQGLTSARINQSVEDQRATDNAIFDDIKQHMDKLAQSYDEIDQKNAAAVDKVRSAFDQFGESSITNFKDAGKAAEQFLTQLEKMAIQLYIMQPLSAALFGQQGTPGGGLIGAGVQSVFGPAAGSIFGVPNIDLGDGTSIPGALSVTGNQLSGGFFSGIGDFLGLHSGGVVGADNYMRRHVHPAYFDHAPRLHSGGIAGLAGDEVAIVAREGEGVFTPAQMQALGSGASGPKVSVNVHNYSGQNARVQQTTDGAGNMNFEVIVDQVEQSLADRVSRGPTPLARVFENSYALKRTPA